MESDPLTFGSCINFKLASNNKIYIVSHGFLNNEVFLLDFNGRNEKSIDLTSANFKILPFSNPSIFSCQNSIRKKLIENLDDFLKQSKQKI